ncbi:hypothetical protein K0I63_15835 [Shewanella rhizosphaerae]|uniref:hypothetical protein n=1 Tax=Shewanella rhizosphaerae TaxID=2864207 RepID=UPI001C661534|nr:hypothetical protein [Shewanella rhizosphaerae]QYK12197.1 hypothetical protein K0I63_15835 [Shewanella rhizosphaerae]
MKHFTAPHKQALKKRVNRFFSSSTQLRADVYDFVDVIAGKNKLDIYVFGGLVRDIGLFGVRDFSSDVDLVVENNRTELIKALSRLPKANVYQNKFGGFRIKHGAWEIDIWCAKDTWAIKNKFVVYEDISSLLKTTFLSWDSALFDVKNQKLICNDDYLENLVNGSLDIILKNSPNELGSMVRLTRAIYGKGAKTLKNNALNTLRVYFEKYSLDEIITYEHKNYNDKYLNKINLNTLKDKVDFLPGDSSLRIDIERQLSLPLDRLDKILNANFSTTKKTPCYKSNKLKLEARGNPVNKLSQLELSLTDFLNP